MLKILAAVTLERGTYPQHVAEEMESEEILLHASMKASQRQRGEGRGIRASREIATSSR